MENTLAPARPLAGKVALITGASRGIGRAVAERLSRDGAAIVVNYAQSVGKAQEVVAALTATGGQAVAIQADMSRVVDIRRLFAQAQAHFGRLDVLVNNAGVSGGGPLDGLDEAKFARIFDLNVRGLVFATQEAARRIGFEGGRIINLSSVVGNRPLLGVGLYAASKAAVDALTRNFAAELGPRNITVNAVAPGIIDTDLGMAIPDAMQKTLSTTAINRRGQPEDVADVVAFLAGPDSRWISGQTIYTDGGLR